MASATKPLIAIACGGTGGHLFPGLAVGEAFGRHGAAVMLLISQKEVDQQAVKSAPGMQVVALPAVGLVRGGYAKFLLGSWRSYRAAQAVFAPRSPSAVLAMGGFTSAPPVLAGKRRGAVTFLHEANTIPGKANRWLAPLVDMAFVNFPSTAGRLRHKHVETVGMPVRDQFQPASPEGCRRVFGLAPDRPVLLVMGGSQGASGINDMVLRAVPPLRFQCPELQFLHLTGPADVARVQEAYAAAQCRAAVFPFLSEMELALGAATVAISRAGASSLAELAAMRVPPILVPYPHATDDHQQHNARALADAGAALLLAQRDSEQHQVAELILRVIRNARVRESLVAQLERWHSPRAADHIAETMIRLMSARGLWDEKGGMASAQQHVLAAVA